MKLRNSNILILGGSSGIGKAIAKRMTAAGASVMITGRSKEKLEAARKEINSPKLYCSVFDISTIKNHFEFFEKCEKSMGGLDAFVNSAAFSTESIGRGYEPWDITEDEWNMLSDTNYKAAFFLMRNEIDYFRKKDIRGNILNISSNAMCMDIIGGYGAAKLAMERWTRAFGKKYGHFGIIINGIAPGATLTPMIASYAHDISEKYERHAIERFIKPEEIAELAFYLLSDYGEIICGHTVVADGGDNAANL